MSSKEEKEEGAKTSNVEEEKTEEENVEKKIEPPHGTSLPSPLSLSPRLPHIHTTTAI